MSSMPGPPSPPPPPPALDWEKFGRYLAGETSPDETESVLRWLDEHPSDARVIAALDTAAKQLAPDTSVDVESALRTVKTRMRATSPARSSWRYAGYAAAAAVLLVVGSLVVRRSAPSLRAPAGTRNYA